MTRHALCLDSWLYHFSISVDLGRSLQSRQAETDGVTNRFPRPLVPASGDEAQWFPAKGHWASCNQRQDIGRPFECARIAWPAFRRIRVRRDPEV